MINYNVAHWAPGWRPVTGAASTSSCLMGHRWIALAAGCRGSGWHPPGVRPRRPRSLPRRRLPSPTPGRADEKERREREDQDQPREDEAGAADERAGAAAEAPGAEDRKLGGGGAGEQVGGRDRVFELACLEPSAALDAELANRAMCAGGPPKPIQPIRPHSRATVSRPGRPLAVGVACPAALT
jgi:hypothetical protein